MKRKFASYAISVIAVLCLSTIGSFANKTSVKIIAPEKVQKGTEITIKIEVSHKGNSGGHHTDWVWVKVNGKEYKKWEYTKEKLPDNQDFLLEFTVKVDSNIEIVAEGHCNRHGTKGENKVIIKVE